tara:strand:- start:110 stop:298 length:189 start_codon:yes stop_codon:yes gene_type:complete
MSLEALIFDIDETLANTGRDGVLVVLNNLGEKNKPFKFIKGNQTDSSCVDVAYLQELHAKHC